MKITFHYYVIKYYQTQWTDNRMPDKRDTDNRGSTVIKKCIYALELIDGNATESLR